VIDDTHLVGFGVAHAKLDVVRRQGARRRSHDAGSRGLVGHVAKIVGHGLFVKRARRR